MSHPCSLGARYVFILPAFCIFHVFSSSSHHICTSQTHCRSVLNAHIFAGFDLWKFPCRKSILTIIVRVWLNENIILFFLYRLTFSDVWFYLKFYNMQWKIYLRFCKPLQMNAFWLTNLYFSPNPWVCLLPLVACWRLVKNKLIL